MLKIFYHSFKPQFCLFNYAWIEGFNLFQKYQINKSLLEATTKSNFSKMAYKYFKSAAQSIIFFYQYWLATQIFCQIEFTKTLDLPKLYQKKVLNLFQLIKAKIMALNFCLYCCHWNKACFLRKVAIKKIDCFSEHQTQQNNLYITR